MDYSTKMSKMKRERGIQIENPEDKPEVIRLRRRSPEETQRVLSQEILQLRKDVETVRGWYKESGDPVPSALARILASVEKLEEGIRQFDALILTLKPYKSPWIQKVCHNADVAFDRVRGLSNG